MFQIAGEEMTLCPYNRSHVVKKLRIQKHILKCKKNYPEVNLASCIYNYSHRLKPEDMLQHYEICCHKIRLDGARYYDADDYSRISSVKNDPQNIRFPDINLKACFLDENKVHSQMDDPDSQQLDSSNSDLDMPQLKNSSALFSDDTHDSDTDSDLEPLPLPKTVSKAFVCVKKEQQKSDPPQTSKLKGFGRGRNFVMHSPPKPTQSTDHSLPDLSNIKCDTVKRYRSPWFSKNDDNICGQSVRSSMLDDATTLKSVDISLDEDVIDDILKDLDKYVKV